VVVGFEVVEAEKAGEIGDRQGNKDQGKSGLQGKDSQGS